MVNASQEVPHYYSFFFVCQIKISVVKQMLSARLALMVHLPDAVTIPEEFAYAQFIRRFRSVSIGSI